LSPARRSGGLHSTRRIGCDRRVRG
jgi:hypothetical protein